MQVDPEKKCGLSLPVDRVKNDWAAAGGLRCKAAG
jgi:hypothetical protein